MNVCFRYLYRDAGNYKQWGEIVFSNPRQISIDEVTLMAKKVLIDGEFFVADKANVPDLHFDVEDEELDHNWHEVYSFVDTDAASNDTHVRDIETFIDALEVASQPSSHSNRFGST